jgi:dCTP deaminase
MILTGEEIKKQVDAGRIKIEPYSTDAVTTNAYDVRLMPKILRYTDEVLDARKTPNYEEIELTDKGFLLNPGDFVLGATAETIGSDYFVPRLHGKSGTARKGLFVNVTADLINPGAHGNITLQLYATLPVMLYPNMPIAQITFWEARGDITLYQGRYAGSHGPMAYIPPQET